MDNVLTEVPAPVYHVSELPPELFAKASENTSSKVDKSIGKDSTINSLMKRIPDDVGTTGFKHVSFKGLTLDFVVSSDDATILFSVYPKDVDYVACPREDAEGSLNGIENGIPATEMDSLVKQRETSRRWSRLPICTSPSSPVSIRLQA